PALLEVSDNSALPAAQFECPPEWSWEQRVERGSVVPEGVMVGRPRPEHPVLCLLLPPPRHAVRMSFLGLGTKGPTAQGGRRARRRQGDGVLMRRDTGFGPRDCRSWDAPRVIRKPLLAVAPCLVLAACSSSSAARAPTAD